MLTHANLLCNAAQVHVAFGEPTYAEDRMVCWLPPFHDMGLMSGVIGPSFPASRPSCCHLLPSRSARPAGSKQSGSSAPR